MKTKLIKDLKIGDLIAVVEPDGVGRVTRVAPSRLFRASGGCFAIDLTIVDGPNKGEKITDQHHPGDDAVEIRERAVAGPT